MVTTVGVPAGLPKRELVSDTASGQRSERQSVSRFPLTGSPVVVSLVAVNIAVFFTLPIACSGRFPYRLESLGAVWGPLVFDGQWWRLLTCSFVHFELSHLFFNMLGLWILGSRVEREFGRWFFLFFYLACGLLVALSTLALRPDVASYGASGAVVGLAGGDISIYGARFRGLSWGTRGKLAVLVLYVAALAWRELSRGNLYLPHTTGLLAGVFLGFFFVYVATTVRTRLWTFIGLMPMLAGAAVLVHRYHR